MEGRAGGARELHSERYKHEMNQLESYFNNHTGRLIHKWRHYFDIYERHFKRFRDKDVVILEIGVGYGGSLQMWKKYFGEKAHIFGVDMDPRCKELEEENVQIFIGSQSDRDFLGTLKTGIPPLDILIDDGGHTMKQQIVTFEELFDHVKEDGVYLCEDLHTSYWLEYGGGHRRRGTFVEYCKDLIDALHAWHSEQTSLKVSNFTRTADSIHFYDSIVVIEKRPREKPYDVRRGSKSFVDSPVTGSGRTWDALKHRLLHLWNSFLRVLRLPSFRW